MRGKLKRIGPFAGEVHERAEYDDNDECSNQSCQIGVDAFKTHLRKDRAFKIAGNFAYRLTGLLDRELLPFWLIAVEEKWMVNPPVRV